MIALTTEAWAMCATAVIGLVVIVLDHLKTRSSNSERLDKHEQRLAALETWKNS